MSEILCACQKSTGHVRNPLRMAEIYYALASTFRATMLMRLNFRVTTAHAFKSYFTISPEYTLIVQSCAWALFQKFLQSRCNELNLYFCAIQKSTAHVRNLCAYSSAYTATTSGSLPALRLPGHFRRLDFRLTSVT